MKKAIERSFSRASKTYSSSSYVQTEVGLRLISDLFPVMERREGKKRLLDLGCGSGQLTSLLVDAFDMAEVTCVDLSHEMLLQARAQIEKKVQQVRFLRMDIEHVPSVLGKERFDLIFSNSVLHWLEDIESTLQGIKGLLTQDGVFACTIFTNGSLRQLNQCLELTRGESTVASKFRSFQEVEALLTGVFRPLVCEKITFIRAYKNILELLRNLKRSGVNPSCRKKDSFFLKEDLKRLEDCFLRRFAGIVVSFEVVVFIGTQISNSIVKSP
ncbi:Biotin synthesis protein BioC [Dissulfuribacter thermophilus]|uniref:Biotin synthesis protein BioC n=1 Tax=Dissulfuribacter thermophilus TaxID=1156395 RepID=A0A1B9F542_9BACT|nr:L-histidine N(alpha)-methyltransferase [Dissulfuribacter thermophilus]OCC14944.1 Biotin synthesis protein BioC [Dissulfuribacter thermophilus]